MRRSFGLLVVSFAFGLGCQKGDLAGSASQSSAQHRVDGPVVQVAKDATAGHALSLVQRTFTRSSVKAAKKAPARAVPVLAPSHVDGFVQGDFDGTLRAITMGAKGQAATAEVHVPTASDGALHVSSEGVSVAVKPRGIARVNAAFAQNVAVYAKAFDGMTMYRRVDENGAEDFVQVDAPRDLLSFTYDVALSGAAGLRSVGNSFEVLDASGAPRLRAPTPVVYDSKGGTRVGTLSVRGCAYDTNTNGPWGRPVTPPGSDRCEITVSFDARGLSFPVLVDPAWVATGTLYNAHAASHMVQLTTGTDAGKVLLAGGLGEATQTELYDPATKTWAASAVLAKAFGDGSNMAIAANGTVLLAGGLDAAGKAQSSTTYRTTTGVWNNGPSMSKPRTYFAMAAMNALGKDVIVIAGGAPTVDAPSSSTDAPTNTAQAYDPVANAFTALPTMTTGRSHMGYAVVSGKLLVVGGHVDPGSSFGSVQTASAEVLTGGATPAWSSAGSMGKKRSDVVVVALPSGSAVATGGWNYTDNTLDTIEYWNGTSTWSTLTAKMTEPRMMHAATLLTSGNILIAGGNTANDEPMWTFTPTAGADLLTLGATPPTSATIKSTASMNDARALPAWISFGTTALVAGGETTATSGSETTSSDLFDESVGKPCTVTTGCATGLTCTEGVCCKSASCAEGATCAAPGFEGICTKPKGASCTSNSECGTGYCVTGVCCATACNGTCQTCNDPSSLGTCKDAKVGTDPKNDCSGDPTCGPFCDGTGGCYNYAPTGTTCGASLTDAGAGAFCDKYTCDYGTCAKTTNNCGLDCVDMDAGTLTCDEATKTCSVSSGTGLKVATCLIDNKCYSFGDFNPADGCQICDPPTSKTSWSPATTCADGGVPEGGVVDTGTDTGSDDTGAVDTGSTDDTGAADTSVTDTGSVADTSTDDATADAATPGEDLPEASTCSCETPGRPATSSFGIVALGALAFVASRRRR